MFDRPLSNQPDHLPLTQPLRISRPLNGHSLINTINFNDDQPLLFDDEPYIVPTPLAALGSQRWIQVAAEYAPHLLLSALRPTLQLPDNVEIAWRSPRADAGWAEYRDREALKLLGIRSLSNRRLQHFWPPGGPVWDALGKTSDEQFIFLEAKANLAELVSPASCAAPLSLRMIRQSLNEARRHFAPDSNTDWAGRYYQYANRLAFHYLFRTLNHLPSHMVFLYFTGALEVNGPRTPWGWGRGIRRLHSALGLPHNFEAPGIHTIFMDVAPLNDVLHAQSCVDGMDLLY